HRLPEAIQNVPRKLEHLVQKENAMVCEADLARTRQGSTADKSGGRDRMVRRPERAHAFTHTAARENTGHGVNRDHFKSFVLAERRQYRRHSPREHGFAGARWPDQQDIMSAP